MRSHARNQTTIHLLWTPAARVVAATCISTASDADVFEGKVRTAVAATEDIVINCIRGHRTRDICKGDVGDRNTVRGCAGGAAIQVVLLDVDAVDGDV